MKKLLLMLLLTTMLFACKKEDNEAAKTGSTPTTPTWNGLYCICFYNEVSPGVYDTVGRECGTVDNLNYYSSHPNPAGSTYTSGRKIYNCSACQ